MQSTTNTFVIIREDIGADSMALISESLRIGRHPDSDIWLNHPSVSRLQAGINEVKGNYYLINLSVSNETIINSEVIQFNEAEAITAGDEIQIGPYILKIEHHDQDTKTLRIRVVNQVALLGLREPKDPSNAYKRRLAAKNRTGGSTEGINALKVFWSKRTREKVGRVSRLKPRTPLRLGKARFNWKPTRDLVAWPKGIITWTLLAVSLLMVVAALQFPEFFSLLRPKPNAASNLTSEFLRALLPYKLFLYGTAGALLILITGITARAVRDAQRARHLLEGPFEKHLHEDGRWQPQTVQLSKELLEKYDPDSPDYPHPVVIAERCIGCQACVDACPHDVFAMVNNLAVPVARDQCMEDTSCQVVCPVSPKACIVVNTTKIIKPRPVPTRNENFMTNVPGCYLIGDVSGTPLIKNAANEGADVITHLAEEQKTLPPEPKAEFDLVIVGAGPAGLSAAMMAKERGIKYLVLERYTALSTIASFPFGKYIFLNPQPMRMYGSLAVHAEGITRENLLASWAHSIRDNSLVINEHEECRNVQRAVDGDYFFIETVKGQQYENRSYRARRIVLALGVRGAPMRLGVPGEGIKIRCNGYTDDKVLYALPDLDVFKQKKIMVVGGGNVSIEAVVDLVALRKGSHIEFRSPDEINEVTLVLRKAFTNDVKFSNKQQLYECIDEGKVKILFDTVIKEIREREVVLEGTWTKEEKGTIENDYVLALIGGAPPTRFLESIGITITKN